MMLVQVRQEAASEEQIVRKAAGGDRAAFGELYSKYARAVHAILLGKVRCDAAEDLVQDVFLAALSQLSRLRDGSTFAAWLFTIARNRAHDYYRAKPACEEVREDHLLARPAPPEALGALEAIRALPEAYREVLMMRLVEGMTGPEIARRTGLTPDSVRVNLCRGMKLLREKIEGTRYE
jgi:RNA polymerase sigma-70 factor (ECF subfamily)